MAQQDSFSQEAILLEWNAPEFNDLKRGFTWYLVAGLILCGMIAYGISSGSVTTVIVFLLLVAVFLIIQHKTPQQKNIRISDMGVHYGKKFYPYHHIKQFWVVYHPPYIHCLYLTLSGKNEKVIRIQLDAQSPIPVRKLLSKEILEMQGGGEPFFDAFSRILRLQ